MKLIATTQVKLFTQLEPLSEFERNQLESLRRFISKFEKVCVAYSGGVDSSLVAAIAKEQLGKNSIAITGVSPALAPHLRKEAKHQANWIEIRHQECKTNELMDPLYSENPKERCFACKRELHRKIKAIKGESDGYIVLDGVNYDDLREHRPGIKAAQLAGVRSPLAELKIGKFSIRNISRALGFPWWDKAAQPCLASRVTYGESITAQRLFQIDKAEAFLRSKGFTNLRVRSQGLSARIELEEEKIFDLLILQEREKIVNYFLSLGFTSVSLDLEGLISGKLNRSLRKS